MVTEMKNLLDTPISRSDMAEEENLVNLKVDDLIRRSEKKKY